MSKQIETTGPASGFKDYLGQQAESRQWMLETISDTYRLYGFQRLETPVLERLQTLQGKAGDESDGLIYKVADPSGEFAYGTRFDLTVPLARFVAQNQSKLQMPFSRYQIGEVYRAERAQIAKGRLRGFTQCDADRIGASGALADAEVVVMMGDVMEKFQVPSVIRINDRRVLDGLVAEANLGASAGKGVIGTIDKVDKIGLEQVLTEIQQNYGDATAELVGKFMRISGNPQEILMQLSSLFKGNEIAHEGIDHLNDVIKLTETNQFSNVEMKLDPTIARGLSYYTGIIYETNINKAPQLGSVCSGGRYDNLVKDLGGPNLPAVGTSVGVDRLLTGLEQLNSVPSIDPIRAYITVMDPEISMKLASDLRKAGIPVILGTEGEKLGKQIKVADKAGVDTVIICGSNEMEKGVISIKNLQTGEQREIPLETYIQEINGI